MQDQGNDNKTPRGRGWLTLRVLDPDDIRTKYDRWTDSEFMIASNVSGTMELVDKIGFIYKYTRWDGLFDVEERNIDGIVYQYGIELEDYTTAQTVCQMFIELETPRQVKNLLENFNIKFSQLEEIERRSFIDAKIANIDKAVAEGEKHFFYGYNTQQCRDRWHFPDLITHFYSEDKKPLHGTQQFIDMLSVIQGAAFYFYKIELLKIKEKPTALDENLLTILSDENAYNLVIGMLYDFEILDRGNNECLLNKRQNGKLYAIINAIIMESPNLLKKKPGVFELPSGQKLLPYFNSTIKRDFKEFDIDNKAYEGAINEARSYIKKGFKL
jgi:hypothetical protein